MKHYFMNDLAIDEEVIGVIEDSIKCNPNLTKEEKGALIKDLCYSQPYDVTKDKSAPRYTFFKADYQPITEQQAEIQSAAPELLEVLKGLLDECETNFQFGEDADGDEYNAMQAARAAIAKAEGN